jgi:glycosyltransferase involved in cell wall biosynthesis
MGIHRYLEQLVRLLLESGAEVTLLTNFPPGSATARYPGVKWLAVEQPYNILWEQVSLPRLLRRHQFDLYWAPANTGVPLVGTGRTVCVWTLHDLIPLRLPKMYLQGRPLYTGPYLVWTAAGLLASDVIVTVSQASAADIRRFSRRKAFVSPSILYKDVIEVADESDDAARDALPPTVSKYLLYNGGLDPRKNVPNLLKAFQRARKRDPSLSLVLMGKGYEVLSDMYVDLGIKDSVVLTGYVSEMVKAALIRGAAALMYVSRYEGFGLPLMEAFANGTPVVTAANSSLQEVAGVAALYVDPDDVGGIAEAMLRVQDPDLSAQLRQAGHKRWTEYDDESLRARLVGRLAAAIAAPHSGRKPTARSMPDAVTS